jgi:4-amino-4-deoxy-L-arabinose transferase-like glycosyltransferase
MRSFLKALLAILITFFALLLLHLPLLRLPYFWDEAGYYIPAALDFYRTGALIPGSTLPTGHTPLVMIYVALWWRILEYSAWVTRAAMAMLAAATIIALYALGRRVATREIAAWSALLLALSPLFFAQTTLVHLDLAVALFTTLAVLFLLRDDVWLFALAASLAVLSKETAVVLLPVAWLYAWGTARTHSTGRRARLRTWAALVVPVVPLAVWTFYYHHATGFWTGNRDYLSYNVYSTLSPARIFLSLLRRAYELFISGFNWLLTACAMVGIWWGRKHRTGDLGLATPESRFLSAETGNVARDAGLGSRFSSASQVPCRESRVPNPWRQFLFMAAGLIAIYVLVMSLVGGAILPRYLLPVMPLFYLATVAMVMRLPRFHARLILALAAAAFVGAWFINPPYPFPFEDNLAYADFIRLHQQTAEYLETLPGQPRILSAWPATDELTNPLLGYVRRPLSVVPISGFAPQVFAAVSPDSFDLLYLYSRKWEPPGNWVERLPSWLQLQERYFDYYPQAPGELLASRYHLRLLREMIRRGQWVRVYATSKGGSRAGR